MQRTSRRTTRPTAPRRRRILTRTVAATVVACGVLTMAAGRASAWKPPTHIYAAETALTDVLDDGSVTLDPANGSAPVTVPVDPTIRAALEAHPEAYRAGTAGPDAYPDILFGQSQIHPDTRTHNDDPDASTHKATDSAYSTEWLSYLWQQAWRPLPGNEDERLRRIAFALGYMGGHANGDTWAHTWINQMAGGVFPDFTDFAAADISVRHVLIEGYVDKHRPGADGANPTTYEMDAPLDWVGDTLVLSKFARDHSSSPLYDYFFQKAAGLQVDVAKRDFDLDHTDCLHLDPDCYKQVETLRVDTMNGTQDVSVSWWECIGATIGCAPDPTDILEPFDHLKSTYEHHWIDDILSGLRAWPQVSEAIGKQLFDGGQAEFAPISAAMKDWVLNHLLSMLGLPDFVGEGIYAASEFIAKIVGFVTDVIGTVTDAAKAALRAAFPQLADIIDQVEELIGKAKDEVVDTALGVADDIFGVIVTAALGFTDLNPAVRSALDLDDDGKINPSEAFTVFAHPERYLDNTDLWPPAQFPGGIRAKLDTEMHLPAGTDDDANGVFRDFDPNQFAPLRDTITMAKLAMLGPDGMNTLVRTMAGRSGNGAALGDLYPAAAPGVGDVIVPTWTVPNNVMLGWHKSLDAEYQWRTNSPHDNRSYGLGTMRLFEDCVSRSTVMRTLFAAPVTGVDAFGDAGDPSSNLSDTVGAASTIGVSSGPTVVRDGKTYVGAGTRFVTTTTDNYFPTSKLAVRVSATPDGSGASFTSFQPAEIGPFGIVGQDGSWTLRTQGRDGCGNVGLVDSRTWVLDSTGPSVSISSPVDGSTYVTSATPLITAAIADSGSGVAGSAATLDGKPVTLGTTIDTFTLAPGLHTLTVSASDALGNGGSASVTFRVRATAASLLANLDRAWTAHLITDPAVYKGLRDSLTAAAQSHSQGKHTTEWNQLASFVNNATAQLGKGLDRTTGLRLIAYAQDLIAAKG